MDPKLRWVGWSFAAFVLLLATSVFFHDQIDCTMWHLRNGKILAFDHRHLVLPYSWYSTPKTPPDGVSILSARNSAQLQIETDRFQGFLAAEQDGRAWQKRYEDGNRVFKNPENWFVRSDFKSKAGLWVCIDQRGLYASFFCKLVGTDLIAKFTGDPEAVNDAKSILLTLE